MRLCSESFLINRQLFILSLFSISICGAAQAIVIGPAETKIERQRRSAEAQKTPHGAYEAVMESYLSGDFTRSEKLAGQFSTKATSGRTEEVVLIRALSLMKLERFEEARPLLENLQSNAASAQLRAQAAYSLGDSYYFKNDRAQADIYYKQALERYPDYGEAQQVRRLLGLSHPALPLRQTGIEESLIYSVQVGSFSKRRNAERLLNKLLRNQLDAYIAQEEATRYFRVRVGHFTVRDDAQALEARLKKDGYPTKIFP